MASSGQILNILDNLRGGLESTERRERGSRKKESKQHQKLQDKLQVALLGAQKKGDKSASLGSILSGIAALSGAGLPLVLALQFAGSLAGGKMGAKKASDHMQKALGQFKGTKFGTEGQTYIDEVGTDVLGKAIADTAITAMTAGAGSTLSKGIKEGGSMLTKLGDKMPGIRDALKNIKLPENFKISPNTINRNINTSNIKLPNLSNIEIPQGVKDVLQNVKTNIGKGVDTKTPLASTFKEGNWADVLGAKADDKLLDKALGVTYGEYQKSQRPSIYEYEVPESLGRPTSYGGYYG